MSELHQGLIRVKLDYAPEKNGPEFDEWCKKYDFDPLGSGRRAWCSSLSTYFRGAAGVAFNDGEMFLFYAEDLVEPEMQKYQSKNVYFDATPNDEYPLRILESYRKDCDVLWKTTGDKADDILANILNKAQKERAEKLDQAIKLLKGKK